MRRAAPVVVAVLATGCKSDQGLAESRLEILAVADGDFDRVEEVLYRLEVPHDSYEGFISQPVWDEEVDADNIALKTEALFTGVDDDGDPVLLRYDALFINSGTRGFGQYEYNSVAPDDEFISDPVALAGIQDFVERGRTLVVTDWGYDLIEAIWPDEIGFVHEDEGIDAAQVGLSEQLEAEVKDDRLAADLEADVLAVDFDFSYWTVIESVSADVTVHLEATGVEYRVSDSQGSGVLPVAPILVSFQAGNGTVVFSSFHWRAQTPSVIDTIAQSVVSGLAVGTADDTVTEQIGG